MLAAHKIRLQCRLERERRRKGENKINGEGLTQATHSYLAYIREYPPPNPGGNNSINPNIIVNGFLMIRYLSCVSRSSVFLTVRA